MPVTGLAPYVSAQRPLAPPRWWVARAQADPWVVRLCEQEALPEPEGVWGLAAPCSLPQEFLDWLGGRPVHRMTLRRLLAHARAFAARRPPGKKHPLRSEHESRSALDRRRLPLHFAALPLLARDPIEVDPPAFLSKLELPCSQLRGPSPDAVQRRAHILSALREGILGFPWTVQDRDCAVASHDALFAVLAAAAAAQHVHER